MRAAPPLEPSGGFYPDTRIDGVELDGAVSKVGRRYFGLDDNPRLEVHTADARPFLRRTDERYDLIFVDAYRPPYVPFYLATREFFALARDRLKPGGMIALNVATVPERPPARGGDRQDAPQRVPTGRDLATASLQPDRDRARSGHTAAGPPGSRAAHVWRDSVARPAARTRAAREPTSGNAWTDDRAPVEWITDRMIVEFAAGGGSFEEFPLPTGP